MLGQSEVLTAMADADHSAPRPRSVQEKVRPDSATSRGVTIRRAVLSETNVIAAILEAAFKPYKKRFTPAAYRVVIVSAEEVSGRIRDHHVWIATDGDLPVGTISIISTVQGFEVRSLGVLPTARGRGVGRSLIRTIEAFAQAKGVRLLPIFTMPFLRAAVRLYERCGYAQVAGCPTDLFRTPLISME
jgi:GNAT superfamily N-acetyltransferase